MNKKKQIVWDCEHSIYNGGCCEMYLQCATCPKYKYVVLEWDVVKKDPENRNDNKKLEAT